MGKLGDTYTHARMHTHRNTPIQKRVTDDKQYKVVQAVLHTLYLEDSPGNGHPLLLSPTQLQSPLSHSVLVPVREWLDFLVDVCSRGRLLDLLVSSVYFSVADVISKGITASTIVFLGGGGGAIDRIGCPLPQRFDLLPTKKVPILVLF